MFARGTTLTFVLSPKMLHLISFLVDHQFKIVVVRSPFFP